MILLLDTSTPVCRLTLVVGDATHTYEWEAGRTLAKGLLEYIEATLAKHDVQVSDIEGIGVLRGPGSFTGLRIGITVLNTIADTLQIPIVGATGEEWQATVLRRLRAGESDTIVMPEYGGDAHITQPRK